MSMRGLCPGCKQPVCAAVLAFFLLQCVAVPVYLVMCVAGRAGAVVGWQLVVAPTRVVALPMGHLWRRRARAMKGCQMLCFCTTMAGAVSVGRRCDANRWPRVCTPLPSAAWAWQTCEFVCSWLVGVWLLPSPFALVGARFGERVEACVSKVQSVGQP